MSYEKIVVARPYEFEDAFRRVRKDTALVLGRITNRLLLIGGDFEETALGRKEYRMPARQLKVNSNDNP